MSTSLHLQTLDPEKLENLTRRSGHFFHQLARQMICKFRTQNARSLEMGCSSPYDLALALSHAANILRLYKHPEYGPFVRWAIEKMKSLGFCVHRFFNDFEFLPKRGFTAFQPSKLDNCGWSAANMLQLAKYKSGKLVDICGNVVVDRRELEAIWRVGSSVFTLDEKKMDQFGRTWTAFDLDTYMFSGPPLCGLLVVDGVVWSFVPLPPVDKLFWAYSLSQTVP
jgi:hypothetical protein